MGASYVKTMGLMLLASVLLFSCNDHASIEVHIDSVGKQRVAAAVDTVKAGLKRAGSRIGEGARELGDRARQRLDEVAGKDSTGKLKSPL